MVLTKKSASRVQNKEYYKALKFLTIYPFVQLFKDIIASLSSDKASKERKNWLGTWQNPTPEDHDSHQCIFFFFLLLLTCINVYILSFLILSQCREYSIFTSWIGICSYFHNNIKQYFYDFGATSPSNKPFFASFIYFGKTLKSNLKTKAKGFNLI